MEAQPTKKRPRYFESFKKQVCRTKEKLKQKLGRVDKTNDKTLEHYIDHFGFQQRELDTFHSSLMQYAFCSQASDLALNRLLDTILFVYEEEWIDKDVMIGTLQKLRGSHDMYNCQLHRDIHTSYKDYLEELSKLKIKILKRDRKLIDYDHARHSYGSMAWDEKSSKAKELKAKKQLQEAWENLEKIHSDLMKEVPGVYDSRILFFAISLKKIFNTEVTYHKETSSVCSCLVEMMDTLAHESYRGTYDLHRRRTDLIPPASIASRVVLKKQALSEILPSI